MGTRSAQHISAPGKRLSSRGRGSLPGSRKSGERFPRVGGFKALDSQIDGEANTILGAVKSPSGSRCFEQSPSGRWKQGKAAELSGFRERQWAQLPSVRWRRHASLLSISGSSVQVGPRRQK